MSMFKKKRSEAGGIVPPDDIRAAAIFGGLAVRKPSDYVLIDPSIKGHAEVLSKELEKARVMMSMATSEPLTTDGIAEAMRHEEARMIRARYERSSTLETLTARVTVSHLECTRDKAKAKHLAVLKALNRIATELYKFADIEMMPVPGSADAEVFVTVRIARPDRSDMPGYIDPRSLASMSAVEPPKPKRTPIEEAFEQLAQMGEIE